MRLLNSANHAELGSKLCKALLLCFLGEAVVHIRPLKILALGSVLEVLGCGTDKSQLLAPNAGVLLLVACGFKEDLRKLLKALAGGNVSKIGVFVSCLTLAGKCLAQVFLGLGALIGIGAHFLHADLNKILSGLLAARTLISIRQGTFLNVAANRTTIEFHNILLLIYLFLRNAFGLGLAAYAPYHKPCRLQ